MTSKVTIDPAAHNLTVEIAEGEPDDRTVTTETLSAGDAPRDYWLYGTRALTVRETQGAP
jgi:hypothetical protein